MKMERLLAASPRANDAFCAATARLAVRCLYDELMLYPKPGLVSPVDNGSHQDMNAATFMRSLFALRHYFRDICRAGMEGADFSALKKLGVAAESRMLQATAGVNTHRGAIFSLGLLCAAAGRLRALGLAPTAPHLRQQLLAGWGEQLNAHIQADALQSHGLNATAAHGASGARQEGALGLPSVFEIGLGTLRATLAAGRSVRLARIDALFALMAQVSDTNVIHRGGPAGAETVRRQARAFIANGATAAPRWEADALACHHRFVSENLSPGGAADLLAASCFVLDFCA
jgi:triphosphoribosyl-dephospho-CoA synthase